MKKSTYAGMVWALVLGLAILISGTSAFAEPWKFAIMADTQWTGVPDDGKNPNSVAVDIICKS